MSKKPEHKIKHSQHKHGNILGVRVDSTTTAEVLTKIDNFLTSEAKTVKKYYVVTPNPEIILKAQEDEDLREILNKANISVPDGVGLKLFADSKLDIVHGRKLMLDICQLASEKGYKIFLLGAGYVANKQARVNLRSLYPNLKMESKPGANYDNEANPVSEVDLKVHFDTVEKINNFAPDIIFVALGAPKQEKWINKYLPVVKAKLAMTVGGALDYLSGEVKNPPLLIEKLELEWLWRLFTQPTRLARIFNAVVIFPWRIFLSKVEKYSEK